LLVELRRLLRDDAAVADAAARGLAGASRHTIAAVTAATQAVYRDVVGQPG
jgi:hypothetical protein